MKINKLSPDIYEIEDFLTQEEQSEVMAYILSLSEDDWFDAQHENEKQGFWYGRQHHGVNANFLTRPKVFTAIDIKIQTVFESMSSVGPIALQRYKQGDINEMHKDYWNYEADQHVRFGVCVYYNDNYGGGEISYPELNITHKPKAGSLVMHGGNILHGTLPVTSEDIRYFSTCFVHGSKDMPVVLNKELFGDIEQSDGSVY